MIETQVIPAHAPVSLQGRKLLITGAGSGLGAATALAAARAGATVVLLGKTVKKLEKIYDTIVAEQLPTPALYPMNLLGATWVEHQQLAETLDREIGELHGLIHCAAHFNSFNPLETLPPKDWMDSLQVNLTAPYVLTRVCLPLLKKAEHASVIFVTESAARNPKAFRGAYGLAKFALEGMVKMWSLELQIHPQLRINSFDPGAMQTELRRRGYPSGHDDVPTADAAAADLLYLIDPNSPVISGQAYSHITTA